MRKPAPKPGLRPAEAFSLLPPWAARPVTHNQAPSLNFGGGGADQDVVATEVEGQERTPDASQKIWRSEDGLLVSSNEALPLSVEEDEPCSFRQIECAVIATLISDEAREVTSQMSNVYLALINAPSEHWEGDGVLRFTGSVTDGKSATAWQRLVALVACGNTTAKKALDWLHDQGIIGYYAGRNGAGIRIIINRAAASIGRRR